MMCMLPAAFAIRKKFPKANLFVLTNPGDTGNSAGLAEFAVALPWIDEVINMQSYERSINGTFKLLKDLRSKKIDLFVSLPQSTTTLRRELRDLLFAALTFPSWAGGFRVRFSRFQKHFVEKMDPILSEAEFLNRLVLEIGVDDDQFRLNLSFDKFSEYELRRFISDDSAVIPKRLLAIAPGAKRSTNRWPIQNFIEVARRWTAAGGGVLVVGGVGDATSGRDLVSGVQNGFIVDLCGKLSVVQTLTILSGCRVALTNDSGAMHMAAAAGIPTVTAASGRDFPGLWAPFNRQHTSIRHPVKCAPCLKEQCTENNVCMTGISANQVWLELWTHALG